ncbi:MAG: DNA methyltransferase [Metallibacterium sp.]
MPLSWNEIKDRALRFAREWALESSEDAEAKSFWDGFFEVFGVSRRRVASFERRVKKIDGKNGYIDLLWKGVLLIEHKSRGKDLDRASAQARDYFHGLTEAELPKYLLVSDFARFRLYDLDAGDEYIEFPLLDLHKQVRRFGFIAGYQARAFKEQDPVNIEAAERMGRLHDALKASGYSGHALEVLLVRLLFCLFADDTGIFPRLAFYELIARRSASDGSDVGAWLAQLFQTLDTPPAQRQKALDAQLAELPYVNGKLFTEPLPLAAFDATMRQLLLDACALDWSRISPAIFGSLFQSVMDARARRNLGAHYTSESNILKLIQPLFLDELKAELERIGHHEGRLKSFHVKLSNLRLLDPACGCGNFLVIAYRELRLLEIEVLGRLYARQASVLTRVAEHVAVDVDQFYGIEIEEFPAQIAQVALWLMDHQMNLRVAEQFGEYFARLPLTKSPTIVHGNALRIDWNSVVPREQLSYILGNPPFSGKKEQDAAQKADMARVFAGVKGAGVLDFVSAWYLKAADYMRPSPAGRRPTEVPKGGARGEGTALAAASTQGEPSSGAARHLLPGGEGNEVRCAFVSTNSITQGEQVGVLWSELYRRGMHIQFAHRTFKWSNEARGKAAVYCVIIGFGNKQFSSPRLFDYDRADGEPHEIDANNLNPYLVNAPSMMLPTRKAPICDVPVMMEGSALIDDGHLVLSADEAAMIMERFPVAKAWIKPLVWGEGFINRQTRFCLWLEGADPTEVRSVPPVLDRIDHVRAFREQSDRQATRMLAAFPMRFGEIRQPRSNYIFMPKTSSERRSFIPMGFLGPDHIVNNTSLAIEAATLMHFGVLTSTMHMAWMRTVCGRLKSDYRYSAGIVYNNFPWPELPLEPLSRRERGRGEGSGRREGSVWCSAPAQSSTAHSPPLPQDARAFARDLRQHGSDAEQQLWFLLRDRRLGGFKFRRQHPLPPYTLDFYCHDACLCVEVDGGQHADDVTRDAQRDAALAAAGVRTLRVWADAVLREPEAVLEAIWNALHDKDARRDAEPSRQPGPSPPAPLPAGEGSYRHLTERSNKYRAAIEAAAQAVLDARARFSGSTLADLYDPLTMPPALMQAHHALDRAVDAAYIAAEKAAGRKPPKLGSDAERVAFLFERYQALTSLLPAAKAKPARKRTSASSANAQEPR